MEIVVNTTKTQDKTLAGTTTRISTETNITSNVTAEVTGWAVAWGTCYVPTPEVIGLQCYNCLFVPSMNYSACLDPNKVRYTVGNGKMLNAFIHVFIDEMLDLSFEVFHNLKLDLWSF